MPSEERVAARLTWRLRAAWALLGLFIVASLAFSVLLIPLQIDFCAVDPEEPQCVERASGPIWPSVGRWALWIGAALACLSALVFAYRYEARHSPSWAFTVSVVAALILIAATAAAGHPLILAI